MPSPELDDSSGRGVDSEFDNEATIDEYRRIVERAIDGIIIHDKASVFFTNRGFRKMFNISCDQDLKTLGITDFLDQETTATLLQALREARPDKIEPVFFEGMSATSSCHLELSTFATSFQGKKAWQTSIRDITQRKLMEERLVLSERLAAAGKLAYNIAHEINNPLGGIITYTHLMLEDLSDGASSVNITETAEKILKLSNRCKIIVGALLDFARDERGGLESIQVSCVIDETLSLLESHSIMEGLSITKNISPELPCILAHRTKIEQVLMNLIINAAEAMNGHGQLGIQANHDPDNSTVSVSITDTGAGIDEEIKRRLFEPFFSTKARGRGTGLGLAISHGIIKQHRGSFEVDSVKGRGTTFTFHLPCFA